MMRSAERLRSEGRETDVAVVTAGAPADAFGAARAPERRQLAAHELTVSAEAIGKKFGDSHVVQGLTFQVPRGKVFGIIGPSGCGKTTTVRMLLGVLRPTEGTLTVMGRQPHTFRRRDRERLGYMPQQFVLFPELSVMENMGFSASIYGMSFFGRGKRIRRTLDLVELWDARDRPAGQLSGGMQRRLELAATLVHNPDVIFLDEPTAGIDPVLRAKFWDHFRALRDEGRTLIVTTQYVTEAEYCDEVLVMKEGREVATGTPEEIRRLAMGGEVVIVAGTGLPAQARDTIRAVDGVKKADWAGRDRLKVIVEDAGTAVPVLMDALRTAGIEVEEVSEQRPSFDDVFVQLMGEGRAQDTR